MKPIYIKTLTGKTIDITNLQPIDIDTVDIAQSLSQIRRYNGHTTYPWTVGQHIIFCSMIADLLGAKENDIRACFLHDVEEYLVQDLIYPIKNSELVSSDFKEISDKITSVVFKEFGCEKYDKEFVEKVDQLAYCYETHAFRPNSIEDLRVRPELFSEFEKTLKDGKIVIPEELVFMEDNGVANIINEHLIVFRTEKNFGKEISSDTQLMIEDMNKIWKEEKTHEAPNKVQ